MKIIPCFKWASVENLTPEGIAEITEATETSERLPGQYFAIPRGSQRTLDLSKAKPLILVRIKKR